MLEATHGYAGVTAMVTGAQGFIGCWLAERLLDSGARVVAPLRDLVPRSRFRVEGIADRCEVVAADVLDRQVLSRTLVDHRIGLVFHLAAQPIVGIANRSPHSTWESNIRGTYTVLEACRGARQAGCPLERIVIASSDHAYGTHETLPYKEDFAFRALFPYDVSKACTDFIARSYAATYGMPVGVTRMANTYGGGDLNWSRIVPDTARALLRGAPPVIRSDGTPQRDYIYVEDAITAYLTVADSLRDPRFHGRAWNVGNGRGVPVLELVQSMIGVSGVDVEPEIRGKSVPAGEIEREYLDSTAIREELGWLPQWDLESGLRAAYGWYGRYLGSKAGSLVADPS